MNQVKFFKSALVIAVASFSIVTLAAWQDIGAPKAPKAPPAPHKVHDTIPAKPAKPKDIDDVIKELDKAAVQLEQEMKKPLPPAPPSIDGEKIKADLEKSLKDLDMSKMKMEMDASIAKIDMEKMKAELQKVKEIDYKKMNEELAKIRPEIEKSMKEAKLSMEKAKAEMQEYKSFLADLEKDGLINKAEDYKIEISKGKITINGKEQPESVNNKYKAFTEKHDDVLIKKDADGFNIHKQ